ncbi:ISL3 family transposase [Paenibacillus tyrfis]|uniref:ISL3 family transposase n=1 Tax=Paenibacillus tyrfis TaxID=1501230 RepID=UPI000B59328E|nr:ISL3 family transposase [Paenibacillus tyrfis]
MNILNLPNFKVLDVKETDTDYQVLVESESPPSSCIQCGFDNLQRFGTKKQFFYDTPMHGKRVGITANRQRYRCKDCGSTFLENMWDIDDKRLATVRLIDYIQTASLSRTFTSIAVEVGMDEKTIRNIFRDYVQFLAETVKFETPRCLGIDEIHIIKKPRCVVANIEENTIIDMLLNRNKDTVIKYLAKLPNKENIQYVAMDMWLPYREAVYQMLPGAKVVVDKFHVVRMANTALEQIRKDHRKSIETKQRRQLMRDRYVLLKRQHDLTAQDMLLLDLWTANYPKLKMAYDLKEDFFKIWDCKSRVEAYDKYQQWANRIPTEMQAAFKPIVTAMKNWENEVFNYFDHPITNAYTESLNSLIRVVNRLGRGYSFDALRAKILFTEGFPKQKVNGHSKKSQMRGFGNMMQREERLIWDSEATYLGVPISTLISAIDEGLI